MQLLLNNDAMPHSLISSRCNFLHFLNNFFYFILRHCVIKTLKVNSSILISYDKCLKFASFCVIELSCRINDYIYSQN